MRRGTEQGHPLSPDLFKLFIRDLSELFYTCGDYPYLSDIQITHLLWADDLVLLALDKESLQNNINILQKFCNTWGLSINLKKTKILTFHSGRKPKPIDNFYLGEDLIESVTSYCYLGIVFHHNGSFKVALSERRKKALRALFSLKRNIMKNSLSVTSLFLLFDSLVKPVLLYGCQIIFPHTELARYFCKSPNDNESSETHLNKIARDPYEKFHLKFLKWCLSVHYKATNVGCWGDTGRYPLFTEALKLSTDYFYRAQNVGRNTLLQAAYLEQQSLNLEWFRNMNSIINTHNIGKSKTPSINIREHICTLFSEKWADVKNRSPKLDFYNTLKKEFKFENYLLLQNYKYRNALTRLRISAHSLYIETGRYVRPPIPREDRFCIFCKCNYNHNVTESELHVITDCPLYHYTQHDTTQRIPSGDTSIHDLFINTDNNTNYNFLAGKLAYNIQETHNAYIEYYSNYSHQIVGNCIIM